MVTSDIEIIQLLKQTVENTNSLTIKSTKEIKEIKNNYERLEYKVIKLEHELIKTTNSKTAWKFYALGGFSCVLIFSVAIFFA